MTVRTLQTRNSRHIQQTHIKEVLSLFWLHQQYPFELNIKVFLVLSQLDSLAVQWIVSLSPFFQADDSLNTISRFSYHFLLTHSTKGSQSRGGKERVVSTGNGRRHEALTQHNCRNS